MRDSITRLHATLLVLTVSGCPDGWSDDTDTETNGDPPSTLASAVKFYNCNHVNEASAPPSGHAYNLHSRRVGGAWTSHGGLNPQPGDWTDCHDEAHEEAALTIDIARLGGEWEVRAIELPLPGEPDCDSSAPDVDNECPYQTFSYQSDENAGTIEVEVTDS